MIADRRLAALHVFDLNLSALGFSTINASAILDKLTSLTEKLLRRNDRAAVFKALTNHYIRFQLEDGLCNLLTKIDKNLTAMQISDTEAYDNHRMELVTIGMELVKKAPPLMSLPIDHLNILINKHCQDREGLMDILKYNDELQRVGKSLDFEKKKVIEEIERVQQSFQSIHDEKDLHEQDEVSHEVEEDGFNVDESYLRPIPSYSFIADPSDTENPF